MSLKNKQRVYALNCLTSIIISLLLVASVWAKDLDEIRQAGVLRHLGISYANFVHGENSGLDVELMQNFAKHLGVRYLYVETTWQNAIADLTGTVVKPKDGDIQVVGKSKVLGDVVATGFTILPWREKIVDFSSPTFPTGVWLIAGADSTLEPIKATGNIETDIISVKSKLAGHSVLALQDSCLDPSLYGLSQTGAEVQLFPSERNLDDMIPAVMAGVADTTLMDVPVALIALEKWPGEIKVIGPISPMQQMACAFSKDSPHLKKAFNDFYATIKADGTYIKMVKKYYPTVFGYYGDFFNQ